MSSFISKIIEDLFVSISFFVVLLMFNLLSEVRWGIFSFLNSLFTIMPIMLNRYNSSGIQWTEHFVIIYQEQAWDKNFEFLINYKQSSLMHWVLCGNKEIHHFLLNAHRELTHRCVHHAPIDAYHGMVGTQHLNLLRTVRVNWTVVQELASHE